MRDLLFTLAICIGSMIFFSLLFILAIISVVSVSVILAISALIACIIVIVFFVPCFVIDKYLETDKK